MITFLGGARKGHQDGGGSGMEELSQRLLKDPDVGIDGGACLSGNRT